MAVLEEFKCPCCDGAIEFNSTAQNMKCPFCDTEFDIATITSYNEGLQQDAADEMNWQQDDSQQWQEDELTGLRAYVCESCGGEIVADEHTVATSCPFCDNPVVMKQQVAGALKPSLIIPFKLDKKAAVEALKRHYSGKVLLPKVFKDENHINEVKGVYVPFWLFHADAQADIRYKALKVRNWSDSNYYYTETQHYQISRAGSLKFHNVPVDGSSKMDDTLMESIEPFDVDQAVEFQSAYLAGYLADKADVQSEQCFERANQRIKSSTESSFASTVQGYSSVTPVSSNIRLENNSVKDALYPVWLLNTTWNGKKYTFAMNGQTGKIAGDLPMDKSLYNKMLWGIGLGASAACLLISWLLWLL